jgi:hypothetical protein
VSRPGFYKALLFIPQPSKPNKEIFLSMQRLAMKYLVSAVAAIFLTSMGILAQNPQNNPAPTVIYNPASQSTPVAKGNNLYCAGFIQTAKFDTELEIVGGDEEGETRLYEQGDYVYISGGSANGVEMGDEYTIIRPRGKMHSPFSKKGNLGVYATEVGLLEIIDVRREVSVAKITMACDNVLLGDLLKTREDRVVPIKRTDEIIDRFAEPNGKSVGRIVLARDGQEAVSKDQIVYIDLGAEDNVKTGDYFTIYRPLGKKEIFPFTNNDTANSKDLGYESFHYRGGKFSNQTPRKGGSSGTGDVVTTDKAKSGRPRNLRKVVGEVVILSVKERTATAVVTRVIQEIHPGDFVELQ